MAARSFQELAPDRQRRRAVLQRVIYVCLIAVAGLSIYSFVALHKAPLPEELILLATSDWVSTALVASGH